MIVNTEEVKNLIDEKFRGNKSWFAEEIGIDRSYLSRCLSKDKSVRSPKICNGILMYCKKNDLDCEKYIFFTKVCE